VLAAGLSARIAPRWLRDRDRILRKSLPALGLGSALIAGVEFARIHSYETRAVAALPAAKADAPNVVMVVLDAVRADHLSLYGYDRDTTPNLRALAKRSITFDLARAPAPWPLPSHAAMFTGRYPHELNVDVDRPLDGTFPTLAEFLSGHGYLTGGFTGNNFYTNAWLGLARGFSRYVDVEENQDLSASEMISASALGRLLVPLAIRAHWLPSTASRPERKRAEEIRRDAMEWVDGRGARPFFLFLNLYDAHHPYMVPEGFPVHFSSPDREAVERANLAYDASPSSDSEMATEPREVDPFLTRTVEDAYDDCLRYLDDQVARLVADLEARGLDRDTWIIVTSDHGELFGERGHYRHGHSVLRPEIDVPLLIVPPTSAPQSGRVAQAVSPCDLPATIADLTGLSQDSPFPGRSLRGLWDGSVDSHIDGGLTRIPTSELVLPAEQASARINSPIDRFRIALAYDDRIYHFRPDGEEELFSVDDRTEDTDVSARAENAWALDQFHAEIRRFRRGPQIVTTVRDEER
jgi:arylsulfatase A-like enzyme